MQPTKAILNGVKIRLFAGNDLWYRENIYESLYIKEV